MFSKMCSWHGPTWYNSCVRRRAWIRKRIKKHVDEDGDAGDGHGLTAEYFTIHSQRMRSQSPERQGSIAGTSLERRKTLSEPVDREDIRDIGHLMAALRESRIDREKMEAIESFVSNARDDLFYLGKNMKDIMAQFIFQASRRLLLAHLTTTLDAETEAQKKEADTLGKEPMDEEELYEKERKDKRIANLMVAVRAADEEVKRLEYWSDIKSIAEEGATKGAVSDNKGWNSQKWAGVDNSAPEPIITKADMPGGDEEIKERHEEDDDKPVLVTVEPVKDKGKGKA